MSNDGNDNSGSSIGGPNAPSNLRGTTPTNFRIRLEWDDNSWDETGFTIERKRQSAENFSFLTIIRADVTSYTDLNLSAGTIYYYRIKSYTQSGESAYSNIVSITTLPGPPDSPTLLRATSYSYQQINISWTDNSFNEEGFKIERKTTIDGIYGIVSSVGATVISFSDTPLIPNTKYYYRLRAYNSLGDSSNSNELSATTLPAPPSAPSGLNASANGDNPYQVSLEWIDNSNNESGFKIQRRINNDGTYQEITNRPTNTISFIDSSVMPEINYYYRLYGWNQGGDGGYSNVATITTPIWQPLTPTQLDAYAVSSRQIDLQWRDMSNNETEFRIERSPNGTSSWFEAATTTANTAIYSNEYLSPTTTYYYRVRAYALVGDSYSGYSNVASATTLQIPVSAPVAPSALTATNVFGYEVTIQFKDQSTNEEGFKVERKEGESNPFLEIVQIGALSPTGITISYTDRTVTTTNNYYYRVMAYNSIGNSAPVTSTVITTKGPPPLAPSALTATGIAYNQVYLQWNDNSSDEQTFKLERKKSGEDYRQILSLLAGIVSYTDISNLSPETIYSYRIRAANAGGYSPYSNEVSATTLTGPPSTPTLDRIQVVSPTQINIFWTDESYNEWGFKIERKIGSDGTYTQTATVNANVTSYSDNTLSANTNYFYKIRAYNANNGIYSNIQTATTPPIAPSTPSNLTATAISPAQINLQWTNNSSNEDGLLIESKKASEVNYYSVANLPSRSTTFSNMPISSTTTYYYRIRAWNFVGMSDYSNTISATTLSSATISPTAPSNLTATAVASYQINLAWQDNSTNEEGFKIKRKAVNEEQFTYIATVGADVISFSDTSLNDLNTYNYQLIAYNIIGENAASNEISATTLGPIWTKKTTSDNPSARWLHSVVYDAERRQVVLFGGWDGDNCNDTWAYDGINWLRQSSTINPSARRNHSLAYDDIRKQVVFFGGADSSGNKCNDTWEYNGVEWVDKNPVDKPSEREGHSMVYDAKRQKIILFGGVRDSSVYLNDTWEWGGTNWAVKNPTNKPSPRTGHAFAYDYVREKIILFGGTDGQMKNDTWEWNGINWTLLNPSTKPSARTYGRMVYDLIRKEIVLFGGQDISGSLDDTWEWNGTDWIQKTTSSNPPARYWHSLTYDSVRKRIILFGGWNGVRLDDTYEYP